MTYPALKPEAGSDGRAAGVLWRDGVWTAKAGTLREPPKSRAFRRAERQKLREVQ